MYCPECKSENSDTAKFCKKCGKPLSSKPNSHEKMISKMSGESSKDNTKIIIIALVVIAVVLAGAFVYLYGFSGDDDSQSAPTQSAPAQTSGNDANVQEDSNEPKQATQSSQQPSSSQPSTSSMSILGGSFSTGSELEDKTYATIYVGPEYAGKSVQIQIWYSRDGSTLNNGNMVPVTVDSSGYIDVASADAYKYFPDYAEVNLYDTSGKLLDTQSVSLSPTSGTQSF